MLSPKKSLDNVRRAVGAWPSWVFHRLREAKIYYLYIVRGARKPVWVFSVSDSVSGFSSDLRGKKVVKYMVSKGYNALLFPPQLELIQRKRLGRILKPEFVVHQKFRIEGNDPTFYPYSKNIIDLDDADFVNPGLLPEMERKAKLCIGGVGGSRYTRDWLSQFVDNTAIIWTSSDFASADRSFDIDLNSRRVIWAATEPLATLDEATFVKAVLESCDKDLAFEFVVLGRGDTGQLRDFFGSALGGNVQLKHYPFMPYNQYIETIKSCAIGLAPLHVAGNSFNLGKSFGKVLGYLASGVPVLASNAADHPVFFKDGVNGYLSDSPQEWANNIELLLENKNLREAVARRAFLEFKESFSMDGYVKKLMNFVAELD